MSLLSEAAFGDFYRRDARDVWTYVYRTTGNTADADDIVQEAFVRLLRADVGALNDTDLRRYVFRVAGNLMVDRWRRAQRERPDEQALANWGRESFTENAAGAAFDVTRTFGELKPQERALLWLAYVQENTHDEIADALGVKRASVKVLLFRARARLRDLLKGKR